MVHPYVPRVLLSAIRPTTIKDMYYHCTIIIKGTVSTVQCRLYCAFQFVLYRAGSDYPMQFYYEGMWEVCSEVCNI